MAGKSLEPQFWIDNWDPSTITDSLKELLALWEYQYPWHDDFDRAAEVFPAASYQYVLYGMGFKTRASHVGMSEKQKKLAKHCFQKNNQDVESLLASLPNNRELLNKIVKYGLQRV